MSLRILSLVPLLAVTACATAAPSVPLEAIVAETGGVCQKTALGSFVSRPASKALGREMLAAAGARNLRWVPKGAKITMDYRDDRLTVRLDANNRVESLACG